MASLNNSKPNPKNAQINEDLDQSLLSQEKLDRASPELWPEQIPGVFEYTVQPLKSPETENNAASMVQELDESDYKLLAKYSKLSPHALIGEVKHLQNIAYQLGLEEAKEMTRGKYLNILSRRSR